MSMSSRKSKRSIRGSRIRPALASDIHKLETDEDIYRYQQEKEWERDAQRSTSQISITSSIGSNPEERKASGRPSHFTRIRLTPAVPPPPKIQPITFEYYAGTGEGRWDHQDFARMCFATVNNFANIARFPALCRVHGGIVFILMCALLEVTLALPITYMEMILGQFTKSAIVDVWRLCPIFKGIGVTLGVLIFGFTMFYPVLVSWYLQFAFLSITDTYVWSVCHANSTWNTPQCREDEDTDTEKRTVVRATEEYYRVKIVGEKWDSHRGKPLYGPGHIGTPAGRAVGYIILMYVLILLVISFGPRVLGRAIHMSIGIPGFFMMILIFRGITLPGALSGLADYFRPDFTKVISIRTWRAVIVQVVASSQCGQGYYTTYASYNQFRRPIFRYALITICLDLVFSFFSGLIVFSFLGHSGYRRHLGVFNDTTVEISGETIMYELMPEAFSRIPKNGRGDFFAFIFFIMIFFNTVDNLALMIDILTTAVTELFRQFFVTFPRARSVVVFLIVLCSCIINVVFTTPGGVYLMTIFNVGFGGGTNSLICCFLMVFAISCVFGEAGMKVALERMTGNSKGFKLLRFVWIAYTLPMVGLLVFLSGFDDFFGKELEYRQVKIKGGKLAAGILIYASLLGIPVTAALTSWKLPGSFVTKVVFAVIPEHEHTVIESKDKNLSRVLSRCPCFAWFKTNTNQTKFLQSYLKASAKRKEATTN